MEGIIEKLRELGLAQYEAKAYLSLLQNNIESASKLSRLSGVPRTRIYFVLENLAQKGWIKIYSGYPLLFRAKKPEQVISSIKNAYVRFLESLQAILVKGRQEMKNKFIIKRTDLGLLTLKELLKNSKTVEISNATTAFLKQIADSIREDALVRVLLFPGEKRIPHENMIFKTAEVKIVNLIRGKEVPSISVILDETRTFLVARDPLDNSYIVDEMLYEDCTKCFEEWYDLGWNTAGGE
ncbi:MAG: TrmB family transcriptional regulator [Candidatus Ranarchaeia archaeon]